MEFLNSMPYGFLEDTNSKIGEGVDELSKSHRHLPFIHYTTSPISIFSGESQYTGELNINKDSSIEKENSHLNINLDGNFWGGSSVSSTEHLSDIEEIFLYRKKDLLVADMNSLKGKINTKNLSKAAATLSDAAQAGLTRGDARTFGTLSKELQKVVDKAETFNNYGFKEGNKKDLEGKLDSDKTLAWLKSDKGLSVCKELGIETDNLDVIAPNKNGDIQIADKIIQLSNDKLNIIEKSKKYNTYQTSTYTLDDKYKPGDEKEYELETYDKYHTNSKFTNLHAKDPKTGKNLHLPENAQISSRAMQGLVNKDKDFAQKLENISGKKLSELKFFDNHAYYKDNDGVEHQFYYDEKNDNFINANVKANKVKGGYDVEVKVPKEKETKNDLEETIKNLSDENKKILNLLLDLIKELETRPHRETTHLHPTQIWQPQPICKNATNSANQADSNVENVVKAKFDELKKANPNINNDLLNIALKMSEKN